MKKIPVRQIHSAHRDQVQTGRFSIRAIQQLLNGEDLVHELHKHDFYFVLATKKGNGLHEIDFVPYAVQNHSVFILRPGQVHHLQLKANSTGFLMEFDPHFYQPRQTITGQRWKKASAKNHCELEATGFNKLHAILSNLFEEFTAKQDGWLEAVKANLDLFFIEFVRQSRETEKTEKPESRYVQDRYEELVELIETNFTSKKNVSDYADLLSMSSYQLNSITKSTVGKTVSDLINEQIILETKRYLLATPNQVKDIADHLGYEDVSYFIRFFKKQTGHSPESFRKNSNKSY
jgi:AraC-like DNA-binding protein